MSQTSDIPPHMITPDGKFVRVRLDTPPPDDGMTLEEAEARWHATARRLVAETDALRAATGGSAPQ